MLTDWFTSLPPDAWLLETLMVCMAIWLTRAVQSPRLFALLTLPGTATHEGAHWLMGFVLGGKPVSVSLFPKKLPDGRWELGSVGFARLRWWSAPPTAMAPMLLAPLAVLLVAEWVVPHWELGDVPGVAWRLFVCSSMLQASWPSSTDFKVAAPGLVVVALGAWLLVRG